MPRPPTAVTKSLRSNTARSAGLPGEIAVMRTALWSFRSASVKSPMRQPVARADRLAMADQVVDHAQRQLRQRAKLTPILASVSLVKMAKTMPISRFWVSTSPSPEASGLAAA